MVGGSIVGTLLLLAGCASQPAAGPSIAATTSVPPAGSSTTAEATPSPVATISATPTKTDPTSTTPPSSTSAPAPSTPASPAPTTTASGNIVINHSNWNWYGSQPPSVAAAVAKLKIFFAHASVGGNILQGMDGLNKGDPTKYPLVQDSVGAQPPASLPSGTIFQYDRGNPAWSQKISLFESYLKNGWNSPNVDIVMNKFCYIDPTADFIAYRNSMVALEAKYPGTIFVYWTMPLTTAGNSDEALRGQFNQNLRNWISTQSNKVLFDLADIEAYSASGELQDFTYKGVSYQLLDPAISSDGGHLNADGMQRGATALYSLFGHLVNLVPGLAGR
jgi:hypothetical protein